MIPKFRAWDKHSKVMREIQHLVWLEDNLIAHCPPRGHEFSEWFTVILNGWEYQLMQSTGLKDKNGVEIFEGDVVLANGVQVTVSFGEQKYEENYGDETYYIGFNVFTKMGYGMLIPVKFEVLGNIHETPELLSKPKEARL